MFKKRMFFYHLLGGWTKCLHQTVNETIHTLKIKYACDAIRQEFGMFSLTIMKIAIKMLLYVYLLSSRIQFSVYYLLSRHAEIHINWGVFKCD